MKIKIEQMDRDGSVFRTFEQHPTPEQVQERLRTGSAERGEFHEQRLGCGGKVV